MAANRHEKGLPMRKVTVDRIELLKKLKDNRVKHVENYNNAVKEYKLAALAEVDKKKGAVGAELDTLKAKLEKNPLTPLGVVESLYFEVKPPKSHEHDYDEIIQMFEMEVNETVDLDSAEFSQYVMDNWDWKNDLQNQRIFYASKQQEFSQR